MPSSSTTIVSKCTIYPYQQSTILKLSVSDLPMRSCHYIGVLLSAPPYSIEDLIFTLKHSLSLALSHFPALAGRLTTDSDGYVYIITCNDAGVDFIHAKAKHLTLNAVDVHPCFKEFFACDMTISYTGHHNPLAAVQITELADCVFVGCTVNHAVTDGNSFCQFFNTFAAPVEGGGCVRKIFKSPDSFVASNALVAYPQIMPLDPDGMPVDRNIDHRGIIGAVYAIVEKKLRQMKRGLRMKRANREIVLPLSQKDLGNEEKALNWKTFLRFARKRLLDIPQNYHGALLLSCGSLLSYLTKSLTTPFDFQFGKSTATPPQPLLTFGEAYDAYIPEMAHIMMFAICYILTWMLVLPLQLGPVQIFCMLLLIPAPLFYFPELVRKALGVSVACGSFKLPLAGFAMLGAIGLSVICGFVTLIMVYFSWRFIHKGKPRVINELVVSLDDVFSHVLEG